MPRSNRVGNVIAAASVALALLVFSQIVLGFVIGANYSATGPGAREAIDALRGSAGGRLLAGWHYWSSFLFMASSLGLLATLLWSGRYKRSDTLAWLGALALMLAAVGFQITGNLLPFDQHDVRTAVVEAGIASRVPIVGPSLRTLTLGGPEFGNGTLAAWYLAHRILLPGLVLLGLFGLLPTALRGRVGKLNWPIALAPILLALAVGAALGTPTGSAATGSDSSDFNAVASYYTWPLHGSLNLFEKLIPGQGWIGAMVVPGLFVGFLALLPWLSRRLSDTLVRGVFVGFIGYFGIAAVAFGGKFAPIVGNQDREVSGSADRGVVRLDPAIVARGKALFATKSCAGCHGDNGMKGSSGPTLQLANMKRRGLEGIASYIADPSKQNPSSTMPAFKGQLTADEMKDLAQFLLSER